MNLAFVSADDGGDAIKGYGKRHGYTFGKLLLFYGIFPKYALYGCYDEEHNHFRCCDAAGGIVTGFEKTFRTPWSLIRFVRRIVLKDNKTRGETILDDVFIGYGISLADLKERGELFIFPIIDAPKVMLRSIMLLQATTRHGERESLYTTEITICFQTTSSMLSKISCRARLWTSDPWLSPLLRQCHRQTRTAPRVLRNRPVRLAMGQEA